MSVGGSGGKSVSAVAEIADLRTVLADVERQMHRIARVWALRQTIKAASRSVMRGVLAAAAALGGGAAHVEAERKGRRVTPAPGR